MRSKTVAYSGLTRIFSVNMRIKKADCAYASALSAYVKSAWFVGRYDIISQNHSEVTLPFFHAPIGTLVRP